MKQKDLVLIIVIVIFSAVVSFFISKAIFAPPKSRQQTVDVVQPITSEFQKPDTRYFNGSSLDPTQTITVSQNNNTNPFNNSSQ